VEKKVNREAESREKHVNREPFSVNRQVQKQRPTLAASKLGPSTGAMSQKTLYVSRLLVVRNVQKT
jgi:hypothetical protein